jgi:molybdopterin molybdotransferase
MISFEEAYKIVLQQAKPIGSERVQIMDSLNRVLAEDIFSDMDMPPFDKSAVDGFACKMEDLEQEESQASLELIETIPAGKVAEKPVRPGQCSKIMTGAMIPQGADCVVMVEETSLDPAGKIIIPAGKKARNICYQGEDIRKGDKVLEKGIIIRPSHIPVFASVGVINPLVSERVRVGIFSTGDELVEPGLKPALSQIRNSNAWQVIAQVSETGCLPDYHGIACDTVESLEKKLTMAMAQNHVVILTGGVSMGEFDYVPEVFTKCGIDILFKSIAIQPGRPTVFGHKENKYIFGLPGNPVSSFVLFEMLVKPFLLKIMGHDIPARDIKLPIASDYFRKRSTRKSLIPVKIINSEIIPLEYHGSAHINAYSQADGIVAIEIGETRLNKGDLVNVRQI